MVKEDSHNNNGNTYFQDDLTFFPFQDWDQDLAELAQGLADECVFKHTNLEL